MTPAQQILKAMRSKGMTVIDLSRKTGLTRSHIYSILRGFSPITADTAVAMEGALGIKGRQLYLKDAAGRYDSIAEHIRRNR